MSENNREAKEKRRIGSRTRTLGILGWPLGHSLSPVMQNAAFAAAGMDCVYLAFPVEPASLAGAVTGMKALGFLGANVTIPHKIAIQPYLDHLDESARLAGAVNTLVFRDGIVTGYNTDAGGFIAALPEGGRGLRGKEAVLLGAGGAARAVVAGLLEQGCRQLTVVVRNLEQGRQLAEPFQELAELTVVGWQEERLPQRLKTCGLLVNCTPLGMAPRVEEEPPVAWGMVNAGAVVCDLVYNPLRTRFLQHAAEQGHQTVSGDGMLLEQGILAYRLWTGQEAPRQVMADALKSALTVQ